MITTFFENVLQMPYCINAASNMEISAKEHEISIEHKLMLHGFNPYTITPKDKKIIQPMVNAICEGDITSKLDQMPDNSFMTQPRGTQNSPDLLVKIDGKYLNIECKSCINTHPQYNSGGIKQHYIYIFCSKNEDKTTIYLGKDILSMEQQRLITEHITRAREADIELNRMLKELDANRRGVAYYTRPMIIQSGCSLYTNYFTHEKREETEANVFVYLRSLIEE
jgi:hypothetical protein